MKKKIEKMCDGKIFAGFRKIRRKLGHHHVTAKRLVEEAGISVKKRETVPKISEKQLQTRRERIGRLRRAIGTSQTIMDDEMYFDLKGNSFYGGNRFACKDISNLSNIPQDI